VNSDRDDNRAGGAAPVDEPAEGDVTGEYRFDFSPAENLPRVSRFVTVRPAQDAELAPFTLSKGRRVTGQVGFSGETLVQPAAPYASIRFFRVVDVEGRRSALLLSQTLTDQNGGYSTTVPTR